MSAKIKALAPRICPQCEAERSFSILADRIVCRRCGYTQRRDAEKSPLPAAAPSPIDGALSGYGPREVLQPRSRITHKGEVSVWARAAYNTGQDYVRQQKWEDAVKSFYRALESQKDFLDAHLWIALLVKDPELKRKHLGEVLAFDPNHIEAIRELMILNGQLAPDAKALDPYAEPEQRAAGGAVATDTTGLKCPQCGSPYLSATETPGQLVCNSCGHIQNHKHQAGGDELLTAALLERRSQPVLWVVGERLLVCRSCGAQRTIPAQKLSERCPFCDSTQVIQRDVLESFQQPDGLLPFALDQKQSEAAIGEQLSSLTERFKNWFDRNVVRRIQQEGIYLPFWVFDVAGEMRYTVTDAVQYDRQTGNANPASAYRTFTRAAALNDVAVCAVSSPPPQLTRRLGDYDLAGLAAYDPALLVDYPAALYGIDFDKASLEARSIFGQRMRELHGERAHGYPHVQHMSFRLLLLPVWVATLYEEDGDLRPALVNGQTGKVVFGKARKPNPEDHENL